jgi:hypothetical protein
MRVLAALKCILIPRQSSSNRRCFLSQFQPVVLREQIDVDPEQMDSRHRNFAALDGLEAHEADGFQFA